MTEYRTRGINALTTVLKNQKNIKAVEEAMFEVTGNEDDYCTALYQTISDIKSQSLPLKALLASIKVGEVCWKHFSNEDRALRMEERDTFVVDGVPVEEGVLQCKKCKSWHVHSTSENTRSGDEGVTVFAQCADCPASWVERG